VTTFKLRRTVAVSPDPDRGLGTGELHWLEAETPIQEIPESELGQLSPAHFGTDDDPDAQPDDWRTNPDTLEADKRQYAANAKEAADRAKRKAAANKSAGD
jgi:hypothetical protein